MTIVLHDRQRFTFDVSDVALPMIALMKEVSRRREHPPADDRPTLVRW